MALTGDERDSARGVFKLLLVAGILTGCVFLGVLPAIAAIVVGVFVGLPILDSIPAFLHKTRDKMAASRAARKQERKMLKYQKQKANSKSKLNKRLYKKDRNLVKNEPTQENVYTNIDSLDASKKEQPKKEVEEKKAEPIKEVRSAQEKTEKKADTEDKTNIQYNNYGTVINVDGTQLTKENNTQTSEERIVSSSRESIEARREEYQRISSEIKADIDATLKQIRELTSASSLKTASYKAGLDYGSIPNINGQNTNVGGIYVGNNQTVVRTSPTAPRAINRDAGRGMNY